MSPGWHSLGGQIVGTPAVVEFPAAAGSLAGQPLFIAVGTNYEIFMRTLSLGWQGMGGDLPYCYRYGLGAAVQVENSTTAVLKVSCNGLTAFPSRDPDGPLWEGDLAAWGNEFPGQGTPPDSQAPRSLGGIITAAPAVAVWAGSTWNFVTGTDRRVYLNPTGQVNNFSPTPWSCIGQLAAAERAGTSNTYFACDGTDHELWFAESVGGVGWSSAQPLGGVLVGGPAIAGTSAGPVFFAEGSDHALWERTPTSGWVSLGGQVVAGAVAAAALS